MRFSNWCAAALVAALVFGISGCVGGSRTVRVKGIVTLDGAPLEGASVVFIPEGTGGREATGHTGADGSFELTTFKEEDGALPGDYKVIILYGEQPEVNISPEVAQKGRGMLEVMQSMQKSGQGKKKTEKKLPAKYTDRAYTILKQKVPPEGPVKLELTSR